MANKALFLDRDGVINFEKNYTFRKEDFDFIPEIFELCRKYQKAGFLIIVITNQAGIARGYYTHNDFEILTLWMINEFKNNNIDISKVYYCPHHPNFTGICQCRKPNPLMIFNAEKEFNLDLKESILIGDKLSDIECGNNAGIGLSILIRQNLIPTFLLNFLGDSFY